MVAGEMGTEAEVMVVSVAEVMVMAAEVMVVCIDEGLGWHAWAVRTK
jgi:hypothetical protein